MPTAPRRWRWVSGQNQSRHQHRSRHQHFLQYDPSLLTMLSPFLLEVLDPSLLHKRAEFEVDVFELCHKPGYGNKQVSNFLANVAKVGSPANLAVAAALSPDKSVRKVSFLPKDDAAVSGEVFGGRMQETASSKKTKKETMSEDEDKKPTAVSSGKTSNKKGQNDASNNSNDTTSSKRPKTAEK